VPLVPTISIFFGIIIQMHWKDHAPPHVHAWYQGLEALIEIKTGEVLAGELPKRARRVVREWVLERQMELMANWARGERREPFEQVPGADVE
jgi:uncharacterized protein DUF4160